MKYYTYTIRHKESGDMYVGKSSNPHYRWGVHKSRSRNPKHRTSHFVRAFHVHGIENFEFCVRDEFETEDAAYEGEIRLEQELRSQGVRLYNEKGCGRGGHSNPSPELRKRLSEARQGEKHPLYGKQGTRLGAINTPDQIAKFKRTIRNQWYGRKSASPSAKTRALWSQQRKGRKGHGKSPLSIEEKDAIVALFDEGRGMTAAEISAKMGRNVTTIRKVIRCLACKQ